jgi:hypothetical protein
MNGYKVIRIGRSPVKGLILVDLAFAIAATAKIPGRVAS